MADEKPPVQRLGRLTPGGGKSKDGVRLGSLKEEGGEAGTSAGAGGSSLASRFQPKNFHKAEGGPVPETKLAEPLPDANARRSNRNTRPQRGGRGGNRGGGGGGSSRHNYESEVVFGGIVGAGAIVKTDMRMTAASEPGSGVEPLATSPKRKQSKRLVKADSAPADGGASGSRKQKKEQATKSDSDVDSLYSSSDSEDDDIDLEDKDAYLPTLLSSLGKNNVKTGDGAALTSVPEELMARPPEDEVELNRQLSWLTEPNVENAGLVLFQLPSVLPIPVPYQSNNGLAGGVGDGVVVDTAVDLTGNAGSAGAGPSTSAAAAAAMSADGRPASLAELPPGKIGKLLVLRNGSVKMQMGEVLFDVSPGIPCQMLQEFAAVDPANKTITMLGEIEKRIVVTPNIDSLLSDEPLPEWKYAKNRQQHTTGGDAKGGAGKNKKGAAARAVLVDSDSSSSSDDDDEEDGDKEMVDAEVANGKEKNGVVAMSEDDSEDTEEEGYEAKKGRGAAKTQKGTRITRK